MAVYFERTALAVGVRVVTLTGTWYSASTGGTVLLADTFTWPVMDAETTAATIEDALRQRAQQVEAALTRFTAINSYLAGIGTPSRTPFP